MPPIPAVRGLFWPPARSVKVSDSLATASGPTEPENRCPSVLWSAPILMVVINPSANWLVPTAPSAKSARETPPSATLSLVTALGLSFRPLIALSWTFAGGDSLRLQLRSADRVPR